MRQLGAGLLAALALAGPAAAAGGPAVRATATLAPRAALFGDTVVARVDAVVDTARVDPRRLRLRADFAPYERAAPAVTSVSGATVRLTLRLRCWRSACLTAAQAERLVFPPATLLYPGGSVRLAWPALQRYSRLDRIELARTSPRSVAPWRGDPSELPRVSYAISPELLHWLLLGGGAAFLACAGLLAARLVPHLRLTLRRRPEATPLERALLVLEEAWARSAAEQRKALELLAAELESQGEPPLAGQARQLAWSQTAPEPKRAQRLAASVRELIGARTNGSRP